MITILLKLFLAHIIGDFFLQPQKWVNHKEKYKLKSYWLYVHVGVHVLLMFLLIWNFSYTLLVLSIALSHVVIDGLKLALQTKKTKRLYFFLDQLFHVIFIVIITFLFAKHLGYETISLASIFNIKTLLLTLCLLFLTKPTSLIMKTFFLKWDIKKISKNNSSLKHAGSYIGVLERIMTFIFIVLGYWEAVGFLITAKSVFRFGDLTTSKERMLTEYILIGTLISFTIAILIGLLYLEGLKYI